MANAVQIQALPTKSARASPVLHQKLQTESSFRTHLLLKVVKWLLDVYKTFSRTIFLFGIKRAEAPLFPSLQLQAETKNRSAIGCFQISGSFKV